VKTDVEQLYQALILEHARHPRNARSVDGKQVERHNPLCGDEVIVTVRVADGRIAEVGAVGQGCALSKASASIMTVATTGLTVGEMRTLFDRFRALLAGKPTIGLGELAAFSGVAKFPVRAHCATLPWLALVEALEAA
jgi:nitrogen fixation NifU-like protein